MKILFTLSVFACCIVESFGQQEILLIGTSHQTAANDIGQMVPVSEAILKFKPDVICTEYRKPTDSVSLMYLYGNAHFAKQDSIGKAWNISSSGINTRIKKLTKQLDKKNDLFLRMELRNLYYVSSDFGNSDYQAYLIINQLRRDSSQLKALRGKFSMFDRMNERYKKRIRNNDEYNRLVFTLAEKFSIPYLDPIDDQSTNQKYEKYFGVLQERDSTVENRKYYYNTIQTFFKKMGSLPKGTNMWVYQNSPEIINDLMYVEAYKINVDNTSEEVKMVSHYYGLRNKKMASYINEVANRNPNKKLVVFFGCSHVGPIREELNKLKKNYSILTLNDVSNK